MYKSKSILIAIIFLAVALCGCTITIPPLPTPVASTSIVIDSTPTMEPAPTATPAVTDYQQHMTRIEAAYERGDIKPYEAIFAEVGSAYAEDALPILASDFFATMACVAMWVQPIPANGDPLDPDVFYYWLGLCEEDVPIKPRSWREFGFHDGYACVGAYMLTIFDANKPNFTLNDDLQMTAWGFNHWANERCPELLESYIYRPLEIE